MAAVAMVAAALSVVSASPASAASTIYVDETAEGSDDGTSWGDAFIDLPAAMAVAGDDDEIRVAAGTYSGFVALEYSDGLAINGSYAPGGSANPDLVSYTTEIDERFVFVNYHSITMTGFLLREVGVSSSDLTLIDSEVSGSTVGAIDIGSGSVTLLRSRVSGNTSPGGGGGVTINEGYVILIDSQIIDNHALGGDGGGIYCEFDCGAYMVRSVLADNTATGDGGGVFIDGSRAYDPNITAYQSDISGNRAGGRGGGISGGALLSNSIVVNNESAELGGGIASAQANVRIEGSVIADNRAPIAGGVHERGWDLQFEPAKLLVTNSIVWNNTIVDLGDPVDTVIQHSILADGPAGNGNLDVDPRFVGDGDYRLQNDSPAQGAGDNSLVPKDLLDIEREGTRFDVLPDRDGNERVQGRNTDMGAYELAAITPTGAVVTEGDSGTTTVGVPVLLSRPLDVPVSVDWATDDTLTAPGQATGGADFTSAAGTITFEPGETTATIDVEIIGDLDSEPPLLYGEWGIVAFSNPSNATIDTSGLLGLGVFIIIDDDPPPVITPGSAIVAEGDTGSTIVNVPITLSHPSATEITVDFATLDTGSVGVATPGVDYTAIAGTVTFAPGETSKNVAVTVLGDTIAEIPALYGEWGLLAFSNPSPNAALDNSFFGLGVIIIIDDDA